MQEVFEISYMHSIIQYIIYFILQTMTLILNKVLVFKIVTNPIISRLFINGYKPITHITKAY